MISPGPSWRSYVKRLVLQCADRVVGRTGTVDADVRAGIAPFLEWRPDVCSAGGLIAEHANPRRGRGGGPIFATGRFRAGTTLLWNVFHHADEITAYYEPFNPRRWFDPAARGIRVDPRHRGVDRYWEEYRGMEDLSSLFRDRWHERNLLMDAASRDRPMELYVLALIERAPHRAALQFNRIDLRLPWFRARFPEATIVHVLRNPRDQWCSLLLDPDRFPADAPPNDFAAHDHFYLRQWITDLASAFPVLDDGYAAHPYRAHYLLWRLSQAFGFAYADFSFAFEELVREPRTTLAELCAATSIGEDAVPRLGALIEPIRIGGWVDWADDAWFAVHESAADSALAALAADFVRTDR